jgi:hypothetical protein
MPTRSKKKGLPLQAVAAYGNGKVKTFAERRFFRGES